MSILINGMKMPKKGEYRMTLYVCDDGYAYMDVDLFPVDKDRFEAVQVPPHGRLIDADQLLAAFEKDISEQTKHMELFESVGDMKSYFDMSKVQIGMISCRRVLDNAPTVIESKMEGEE